MSLLKVLLWPLALLYNVVMRLRNYFYDIGHKPSFSFETVVISVGNLNVGGSGKTPMIEYLVRLLQHKYSIAILSRGYGRKTKGFRIAGKEDNAMTLGDEPFQYYRKFGKEVTVAVGEERALAIPTLLNQENPPDIILMDDAFQHRSVKPQLSILLTEKNNPFYKDFVFPMGRLRESRYGAKRADAILITKCNAEEKDIEETVNQVSRYAGIKPVYCTGLSYKNPEPFEGGNQIGDSVILVSGVANSAYLEKYVATHFRLLKHFNFEDHHSYSISDIEAIEKTMRESGAASIITTEKDMVKLISTSFDRVLHKQFWFSLPIETIFLNRGSEFDEMILLTIENRLKELESNAIGE